MASWLVHSSPGRAARVRALVRVFVLCSWARHFTLTVPLSTQVYKWVQANLMLGVTLRWTSIPSSEEYKYSQSFHATETRISSGLIGYLAQTQTLPTSRSKLYLNPLHQHFKNVMKQPSFCYLLKRPKCYATHYLSQNR